MSLNQVSRETGLGKSYLSYLESGEYKDVGIDKLARILVVIDHSADWVLREAGYLPDTGKAPADTRTYLRNRLGLSQSRLEQALGFLEYLAAQEAEKAPKPSRRKKT